MWKNIDKDSQTLPTHQLVSPKSKKLSQTQYVFFANLLCFFAKTAKKLAKAAKKALKKRVLWTKRCGGKKKDVPLYGKRNLNQQKNG